MPQVIKLTSYVIYRIAGCVQRQSWMSFGAIFKEGRVQLERILRLQSQLHHKPHRKPVWFGYIHQKALLDSSYTIYIFRSFACRGKICDSSSPARSTSTPRLKSTSQILFIYIVGSEKCKSVITNHSKKLIY